MYEVFQGTEIKLNVNIEPITTMSGIKQHMSEYDFDIEVYCNPSKVIRISKNSNLTIPIDDDNYAVLVDTGKLGIGIIKCKVLAYINDGDFTDGKRTEVVVITTDLQVVKS